MRILITGGVGYIGTELIHKLAKQTEVEEIIVYDNLSRKNYNLFLEGSLPDDKITFVQADILDTRRLEKYLNGIDVVYHLAAFVLTPFSNEKFHQFEQINHWGTAEVSYLLEKSNVSKIIYLSSASVYGLQNRMIDKTEEPRPTSHYGISKLNGEKMIRRLGDQKKLYIIRSGNVYGYSRSMRFDSVINKFMFYAHHLNQVSIYGKGDQNRAFIHIDNLSKFLADLSDTDLTPGLYDFALRNLSVEEVMQSMKTIYPDLETLYISQDLVLDGIQIAKDKDLPSKYLETENTFEEELNEIKSSFSIRPMATQS
ncbi:MAG: SDR family oxidoreductase [Cyclobacteriaceae bacterium]